MPSPIHFSKTGSVKSTDLLESHHDPHDFSLVPERVVFSPSLSSGGCSSPAPHAVESSCSTTPKEVSQGSSALEASHLEAIKRLIQKARFFRDCSSRLLGPLDPWHIASRGSGPNSSTGVMEGILLHAWPLSGR